jgi:hypothetical protein
MTADVVRLPGDYKIVTKEGGSITLDTINVEGGTTGTITLRGNLVIEGDTTLGNVSNVNVQQTVIDDNMITLNAGETGVDVISTPGSNNRSGLIIDRGQDASLNLAGQFYLDDSVSTGRWVLRSLTDAEGSGNTATRKGVWRFKVNNAASVISVAGIKLDRSNISEAAYGGVPRLNLIGYDANNPVAFLSVQGVSNYAGNLDQYGDDNDIPNKKYVDDKFLNTGVDIANTAKRLQVNNSYITITDQGENATGLISFFIDDYLQAEIGPNSVSLAGISIGGTTIQPYFTATNITLQTTYGAELILDAPVTYQVQQIEPQASPNQVKVYSTSTAGAGGTGLLFVNPDGRDELVSSRKMMIYSIIF